MYKKIAIVLISTAIAVSVSGCAGTLSSQTNPVSVGTEDSFYDLEYVGLPDGRVLTCLWYAKGSKTGSMSCDWENAK